MKAHTNNFKEEVKTFGRQLDSIVTYTIGGVETQLGSEELNSVTPHFQSDILKSVMKQLDIDSNVFIPVGTVVNYQFGVLVNGTFEYLDYGNYIVYSVEKQEDTNSYKIVCYDKMLLTMKPYAQMPIKYPITIRDYINSICVFNSLTFANRNDVFANYDKMIQNELYLTSDGKDMNYTFRDVLDELAQVTASTICINDNDELEIRYINDTNDTIDEEFLKDVNVNFGEKYGPINSIVLSRAGGSDNVYLQDEQSVTENGLCEIKISDNQIMNFNDRSDYLPDILEKLDGLEYYLNDFSSTGICYYDVCDRYNVSIGENIYSCIMFNDEINITQGLEENVHTDMPEQTETDYTKADKTDRRINQTYIIVDKQNQVIQSLAERIVDVSETKSGVGSLTLENAYKGELHKLSIKGQISLLFPQSESNLYGYPLVPSDTLTPSNTLTPSSPVPYGNEILYPSSNLFLKNSVLLIDDTEYKLDFNFLNYINNDVCDEFIYEDGKCQIIRRVGIDSQGNKYALDNEVIENRKDIVLEVDKESVIRLKSFDNVFYEATYLLENDYTETFATNVRLNSTIEQTTEQINLKVSKNDIISEINQSAEEVQINANKISLNGKEINLTSDNIIIDSDKFKVDENGNMTCVDGEFIGKILGGKIHLDKRPNDGEVAVLQIDSSLTDGTISGSSFFNGDSWRMLSGTGSGQINATVWENKAYFNVSGDIYCSGTITSANGVCQGSREEIKKNFEKLINAKEILNNTDIYKYNLKSEKDKEKKHIGFIIGDKFNYSKEITSKGNDKVDLYSMISVLWQVVKEQQEIIDNLKQRIEILESKESDL